MRVLHVLNGSSGGAAESTLDLIRVLAARGIESAAVCHTGGSQVDLDRVRDAVGGRLVVTPLVWWNRKIRSAWWKRPIHALLEWKRTGFGYRSSRIVADAATTFGSTLIHTNTLLTPEGSAAAKVLGIPHVWNVRELTGEGQPFRFRREGPALLNYLRDHADAVICNSAATEHCITGGGKAPDFLHVAYDVLDLECLADRTRVWGASGVIVGMVASLESLVKKHPLFIRAAAQVRSTEARFVVFGSGVGGDRAQESSYVTSLRSMVANLGISDRLTFMGHVTDRNAIYNAFDILAHPADGESFGRIGVEAMAAGIPAIVPSRGGLAEVIENAVTGLHFSPDDAESMAAAIDRLIAAPSEAQRLGANGRRQATSRFSSTASGDRVIEIYERAIAHTS